MSSMSPSAAPEHSTAAATSTIRSIILDRMLPDMDGLDVCRRLREDAHGAAF